MCTAISRTASEFDFRDPERNSRLQRHCYNQATLSLLTHTESYTGIGPQSTRFDGDLDSDELQVVDSEVFRLEPRQTFTSMYTSATVDKIPGYRYNDVYNFTVGKSYVLPVQKTEVAMGI